jgi:phosphomannomutase
MDKRALNFTAAKSDRTDGLKLIWKNSWVHIRESNTEPIIRIYAEGKTEKIATDLVELVKQLV